MAQINQDRYETLAARALGVKGAGIFGHAEDAIFAGLALDTNAPIELWYPQRIFRFGAGREVAAHATQRGGVELRNTTQDQLWIVEEVTVSTESGVVVWSTWVGEGTTADFYATVFLAAGLDTRIPGVTSQDVGSQGTGAATIPGFTKVDTVRCPADVSHTFRPGVILAPGGSFIVNAEDTNRKILVGLTFHTRQAMPGEFS